jgi:plasmid stabilization system protein ParE
VKPVRYDPDAVDEYLAAVRWYAARNRQAAERFIARVAHAEEAIAQHPAGCPLVPGVADAVGARRALVRDSGGRKSADCLRHCAGPRQAPHHGAT